METERQIGGGGKEGRETVTESGREKENKIIRNVSAVLSC